MPDLGNRRDGFSALLIGNETVETPFDTFGRS
jgi:hypothetical protein